MNVKLGKSSVLKKYNHSGTSAATETQKIIQGIL
jgi:hypothetical protein